MKTLNYQKLNRSFSVTAYKEVSGVTYLIRLHRSFLCIVSVYYVHTSLLQNGPGMLDPNPSSR